MANTREELNRLQALPLDAKIATTKQRIKEWVDYFGEDGVYIAFSGGKDSTVLLHIARELYSDNLVGVFCDTGLEYPEIRNFVKTFNNIEWLKPKKNFKQVINEKGYPFISKEIAECVGQSRPYFEFLYDMYVENALKREREREQSLHHDCTDVKILTKEEFLDSQELKDLLVSRPPKEGARLCLGRLLGILRRDNKLDAYIKPEDKSNFNLSPKWKKLLVAPFNVTSYCCNIFKKNLVHSYSHKTGRVGITAQMASESQLRLKTWMKQGCNAFNAKEPISNPMSFWTEQDVLLYIKKYNIPICSVYGDVVDDNGNNIELTDYEDKGLFELDRPLLKTTGCHRTGCIFCMFGGHLEKENNSRLLSLKQTHPKQYEYIMKSKEEGGLGYKEVIDWINENCKSNILY